MKSQDILLLLKLVAIERGRSSYGVKDASRDHMRLPDRFRGWEDRSDPGEPSYVDAAVGDALSVRGLAESTGISKSEISNSIKRCSSVGLAKISRRSGRIAANHRALFGLICHGVKYMFPATIGTTARGIPTGVSAPIVKDKVLGATTQAYVWEDEYGRQVGLAISALYKSVPHAVRRDPDLYAMLALVDSIRIGREREAAIAQETLGKYLLEETFDHGDGHPHVTP